MRNFKRFVSLASVLCATVGVAQDVPTPRVIEGPAAAVTVDLPWDAITAQWTERRYKVEAIRFKARDETGVDWWGSDEVMVGIFDAEGDTLSRKIGDIDSGDTHDFDPAVSCIIGVLPGEARLGETSVCDPAGKPGPFSFRVEMWEKDRSIFGEFCNSLPPTAGRHTGPGCLISPADDFIGLRELFFPIPDLESTLPNVGDSFTETVVLGGCPPGYGACADWLDGDYSFSYRTTRLPDVTTDFRSQLVAAMERSHIQVAGDAVAAAFGH